MIKNDQEEIILNNEDDNVIVIGIVGISRSGKSTLSKYLGEFFKISYESLFCLDNYISHPIPKFDDNVNEYIENWEDPDLINFEKLKADLNERIKFEINQSKLEKVKKYVLIEGFILFNLEFLYKSCNIVIKLEVDYEMIKKRRLENKNFHGKLGEYYFDNYILPSFLNNNKYFNENDSKSFIVNGNQSIENIKVDALNIILKF